MTRLLAISALADVAGGESTLLRALPALARRGYEPRLAVPARGELATAARARRVPTVVLPLGPPEKFTPQALAGATLAAASLLRSDVVWLNGPSTQRLVPSLALTGRRAVLRVNNPVAKPPAWWRRSRYWQIVRAISVPSTATARECVAAGAPAELVHVMPPPAWGDERPEPHVGRQNGALEVGFVGTLESRKGVLDLVQAAGSFLAEHADARLVVIGQPPPGDDGRYAEQLRDAAARVPGPERILFPGHVPNAAARIAGFDLLVIPSHAEPLASVTGEAAAAGVPVVATSVGGLAEGVGDGGVLVAPQDPRALASAISTLLGDPEKRRQLGQQALAGASRFDPDRFAQDMDGLLRQVQGTSGGRVRSHGGGIR
jgi:glycosyltransferase involved in cell wall biosynthesis